MFTFDESELINSFFEEEKNITKDDALKRIEEAITNTDDSDLIKIAKSTVEKIKSLDNDDFNMILRSLPFITI